MLLSVIIPTCNRNELLGKCLDRLKPGAQTLSPERYELIVTDDGPGQGSAAFVAANYPSANYMRGPRRGPAANRNNGVIKAKGKWLVFIDDDCIPSAALLESYANEINVKGSRVLIGRVGVERPSLSPLEYAPVNESGSVLISCNFCINRELFESLGGFDENFIFPHMEDIDLGDRISEAGVPIFYLHNASVVHPWRKLSSGYKLGRFQEMYVYYAIKRKYPLNKFGMLKSIVKTHHSMLKGHRISIDYAKSVIICLQHLFVVAWLFKNWKLKYVGRN